MKLSRFFVTIIVIFTLSIPAGYAYYTTKGKNIVDRQTGATVLLRGFGIGCWLLPEGYMWGIRKMDRPRQFEQAIEDLIGEEDAGEFWRFYYQNFFTEGDVKAMKMWGVNSIRIALLASFLQPRDGQPEKPPYIYSQYGFELLDTLVTWCEKYQMGIIWDLHGAPGAQNAENISDSDGEARLWTEKEKYWPRCIDLWYKIAARYQDKACVIGYDLLNEPLLRRYPHIEERLLRELYIHLTDTIRTVDPAGIIFIEGDDWAQNFELLEPLDWDLHLVIAFHSYPPTANLRELRRWDVLRQKYNIPLWHGETGEQGPPYDLNIRATTFLEAQNVGWSWWTHKKFENNTQSWNCPRTPGFNQILAFWNGKAEKPTRTQAKAWLWEQAQKTHTDFCEFLPEMVRSLKTLDPDGYLAAKDTVPPVIIQPPTDIMIQFGDPAWFSVRAIGHPLNYQWFKNGELIPDANKSMLRIEQPDLSENNSKFAVKVFNEKGTVTGPAVTLNINPYSGPVIRKATVTPKIDGQIDKMWESIPAEKLKNVVLGEAESPSDLSATFKAVWDEKQLYLLIQVSDDILSKQGENAYERDGVEIYIDSNNSKSQFYGADDFHFRYNWNEDKVQVEKNEIILQIECAQQNTENGYTAEIAFPWAALSCQPKVDQFIGFDLHVNDNDSHRRACKIAWKAVRDHSHRSPAVFGTIRLGRH